MGSGVARRDPDHVTPKVNLCIHTMFKVCCSNSLYGQSTIFGFIIFFGLDMDTEIGVVIYMYLKHSPD